VTWDNVRQINQSGFSVVSRQVLADPPDASALPAQFAQYEVDQNNRATNPWQYLLLVASILLILTEMILLISKGTDVKFGARPLRRAIQREIEDALSERILFGELQPGQVVTVGVTGEGKDRAFTFNGE